MNSPSSAPRAATEDQVKAFLHTTGSAIMRASQADSLQLSFHFIASGDRSQIKISLQGPDRVSFHGDTVAEVLAAYDEQHSPAALLTRAANLRAQADAIAAKVTALPLVNSPAKVTGGTRVLIVQGGDIVGGDVITWQEFVDANRDGADEHEIAEWKKELETTGQTTIGGGAAPLFTVRLAA